jgi:signal transduction histidine kinase
MAADDARAPAELALLFSRLDQLRQAERRAASARVASVIGHLIGTPLNVIAGRAALIRSNPTSEAVTENVRRIEEQVERVAQRIRRLIDYLGVVEQPAEGRTVEELLRESDALYGPVADGCGVSLKTESSAVAQLKVDGRPALLVLTSLLSLAARNAPPGALIELRAREQNASVVFDLHAPGLEVPPSRVDRLEPPEQGTTYDSDAMQVLSICFAIARRSGGRLEVSAPRAGSGVVIRVECPKL